MDQDETWHAGGPRLWPHCHIVLHGDPAIPPQKGTAPIFGPDLLWPNGWMDYDATWYGDRHRPRRLCVRWGPSSPSPKRGQSPQIFGHVYCGQTAGWIRMPLGAEVGLSPGDTVLDGVPAPPPKGTQPPIFAHVYCGETSVYIRIPFGTEVSLGPGDFMLDGDPAPSRKFSSLVYCGQTAGWIKTPLGIQK